MNITNQFSQEKLNSCPSFQISSGCSGSGGPPCSVVVTDQKPPLCSKTIIEPIKEFVIVDKFTGSEKYHIDNRVKNMLWNITKCREGNYRMPHHKTCGYPLLDSPVQLTCGNKYCSCEICIERRNKKAWYRLKEFGIRSKRLIHLIIGFERTFKEDKNTKQRRENIIRQIKKDLKKTDLNFKAVVVWDMEMKERGNLKRYYMHLHLAVLPVKDYRKLMLTIRSLQEKLRGKATIKNKGFRPKKNLFSYFAKIMAGLLSGDVYGQEEHHTLTYSDLMSPEEYMDFFYKKRSLRAVDLEKKSATRDTLSESEGYLAFMGISLPEKCPNCGEFITWKDVQLKKFKFSSKPPPVYHINEHLSTEIYSSGSDSW